MKSFTKREVVLVVVILVGVVVAVAYGGNLQRTQSAKNANNNAALAAKDAQLAELTTYNATICAEYRKLYGVYKEVVAQSPSANGADYALPGSAKGEVDDCYQSE